MRAIDKVLDHELFKPLQRAEAPLRDDVEDAIFGFQTHTARDVGRNFALGPLHRHRVALNGVTHALGQRDRLSSNSRHNVSLSDSNQQSTFSNYLFSLFAYC